MANNPEILVRMTKRPAGKDYECSQCAAPIKRGEVYRRIRTNLKVGASPFGARVVTLCNAPACTPRLGLMFK